MLSQIGWGDLTQGAVLTEISDSLEKAKIDPVTTDAAIANAINDSFKTATGTTPAKKPDFMLFEIRVEGGVTSLVHVSTSTVRKILGAQAGEK